MLKKLFSLIVSLVTGGSFGGVVASFIGSIFTLPAHLSLVIGGVCGLFAFVCHWIKENLPADAVLAGKAESVIDKVASFLKVTPWQDYSLPAPPAVTALTTQQMAALLQAMPSAQVTPAATAPAAAPASPAVPATPATPPGV
jgi:hypothetical protein